jgi:biotin carboxylase
MHHFLFINANTTGLRTINHLIDMGYKISYIESPSFKDYHSSPETDLLKSGIDDTYYFDDIENTSALIELTKKISEKQKIDGVICINEYSMESAAVLAEYFGFSFPKASVVKSCRNKEITRDILNEHEIRNAKYCLIHNSEELIKAAELIGYPVVVKPKSSGNSFATAIVHDQDELRFAWQYAQRAVKKAVPGMQVQYQRGFIVEEYLAGKMVSIELAHDGDKAILLMISGRERTVNNELTEYRIDMPAALTEAEWTSCENYGKEVLNALSLTHGIFHIEVMITEDGPIMVEVNPRLMGSYMPYLYNNLTGNDIFCWLAKLSLGNRLQIENYKRGKQDKVASAIRFDAAQHSTYCPSEFRDIVLRYFNPVYFELPDTNKTIVISPGTTLGRIQVIFDNHEELNRRFDALVLDVRKTLKIELMH